MNAAPGSRLALALADLERDDAELARFLDKPLLEEYETVVIGSGPGGATLAHALAPGGGSILIIERGDFLPHEPDNWDSRVVLEQQRYANTERWQDASGNWFQPFMYYYVGGMAKVYSASLIRFRAQDFEEISHEGGRSPAWPISYGELEPYYAKAERLYWAHGRAGEDPTEAPRSGPFPHPPVPIVPEIAALRDRLRGVGLRPFCLPQGLALGEGGRCVYCAHCDSHPCRVVAKGEPELCCIRPALRRPNVTLLRNATARRLLTDPSGREVVAVEVERAGEKLRIGGGRFAVACGAVNTPVLLLRSANERHPNGLANDSGLVGACYMRHECTVLLTRPPDAAELPQDHYWKSIGVHDYLLSGNDGWPYPLGAIQAAGNLHEYMAALVPESTAATPAERAAMARQMLPLFLVTEDLPSVDNRVELTAEGAIRLTYRANNVPSHRRLIDVARAKLKEAGYAPSLASSSLDVTDGGGYHHCGTARFGDEPATSVLDRDCRAHGVRNLFVVDASVLPSAAALNPVLTIAANALRVADVLMAEG